MEQFKIEIYITTNGKMIVATLTQNDNIIKRVKSPCRQMYSHDKDTKRIVNKLFEKEIPTVPYLENDNGAYYGRIGEPTKMTDITNEPLHVGDIVKVINRNTHFVSCELFVIKPMNKAFIDGHEQFCFNNGNIDSDYIVVKRKSYKDLQNLEEVNFVNAILSEEIENE